MYAACSDCVVVLVLGVPELRFFRRPFMSFGGVAGLLLVL